jgi:hypothetical protein
MMQWVSFEDNVPGVLAVSGAPVGIIAIGGMPLGVIAVGFGSIGGVSIACGGSLGIVSVSCGGAVGVLAVACGTAFGLYGTGVGVALGLKASCVGSAVSIVPEEAFPGPSKESSPFAAKLARAVDIRELGKPDCMSGWVAIEPVPRGDSWALDRDGAIELEAKAREVLAGWSGRDPPIRAHVVAEVVRNDVSNDYRSAPAERRVLRCDEIELPPEPEPVRGRARIVLARVRWIAPIVVKGTVLLTAFAAALFVAADRVRDARMPRREIVTWKGEIVQSDHRDLPARAPCRVTAVLRGDGDTLAKVESLSVKCAERLIYAEKGVAKCGIGPSVRAGRGVYHVACHDPGVGVEDDDHAAHPKLDLETDEDALRLVKAINGEHVFDVTIALDPSTEERSGDAVLTPASASPGAPSSGR